MCTVRYTEVFKSGATSRTSFPCFSQVSWEELKQFRYEMPARPGMTREIVQYWVDFCKEFLTTQKWSFTFNDKTTAAGVWTMDSFSGKKWKDVVYAAAFRYPDEFPSIATLFWENREKVPTFEARFRLFQDIHISILTKQGPYGKEGDGLYLNSNHMLFAPAGKEGGDGHYRYWHSAKEPITYERFLSNLSNTKINTMQGHFS